MKDKTNTPRSRGRPPSEEKRRDILEAATRLFTERGFEGTSVDDIAAAAGVSKQTVYSHFGNKENLFGIAVSNTCRQSGMDPEEFDLEAPPEKVLKDIARSFVGLITSKEALRVHAICTSCAEEQPSLAHQFYKHGPEQAVQAVAGYLDYQNQKGALLVSNPQNAAWQLLCMLKGEGHLRCQFNLERLSEQEMDAYTCDCVDVFLRAYAPR